VARRVALCLVAAVLAGVLGACDSGVSAISVTNAWARPAGAGGTGVAYLTIVNTGAGADTLTGVATDAAAAVELHRTAVNDGVASMERVRSIAVPAHGEVRLEPGGYHLMLAGLRRDLRAGDVIVLTLTFERAGPSKIGIRVRDQ
jgi:hypothetical protein